MMQKEFNELSKGINTIGKGIFNLEKTLDKLLSRRDKLYKITIGTKVFEFRQVFTNEDRLEMEKLRSKLIKCLISRALDRLFKGDVNCWSVVLSLAMGVDPKDLQIEKYYESEEYEVNDDHVIDTVDGKGIQLTEHNAGSWVMKQQLTRKARNHNPITGKPFNKKKKKEMNAEQIKGAVVPVSDQKCW